MIRPPAYSTGLMGVQLVPFLGITYIAAAARGAGHNVDIIDMCGEDITHTEILRDKFVAYGMPFSALDKRLKQARVIGFTCTFSQDWAFHRELIRYVHNLFPESLFVAGGEHITALPEYCLEDCPELDACVVGEGEDVFVQMLEAVEKEGRPSGIQGLVYRNAKTGLYSRTPRASRIKDIDRIPPPAWELTPLENYLCRELNYHIRRGRTIPLLATRGCPYRCTFCSNSNMWGSPWIARDPRLVADEMQGYIERYQAKNFVFSDLTAVVNKESIIRLCNEIIQRNMNITWQLPTLRTEAVDRSVLELMYRAGCRELDFAVESGSKDVLKSVNKANDPEKIFSLIKDGLDTGMNLSVNIVIGLPQEGLRDFLQTCRLAIRLALAGLQELNVFPFIPYPGSKLFEEFLKNKKVRLNDDYFFSLFGYADLGRAVSWSERFGPRTLNLLRLVLLSSFYAIMLISHPGRVVMLIKNTLRNRPTTKLEGVLGRIVKNLKAYFIHKRQLCKE